MPQLRRKRQMTSVVSQQDGAPPHFSNVARNFLSATFPSERIISRGLSQNWPAQFLGPIATGLLTLECHEYTSTFDQTPWIS